MSTLSISITVLAISIGVSFFYGLFTRNYSTVDRLWSILPVAYVFIWLPDHIGNLRYLIAGTLVTAWGIRLTTNFAIKGGYGFSFSSGFTGEDYRWEILRNRIDNRILFELFNLLFISTYQLVLIFLFTLPLYYYGKMTGPISFIEVILYLTHAALLILETIADISQLRFYARRENGGSRYRLGFNTFGLWKYSRHPNYVCEMGQWIVVFLYLYVTSGTLHYSGLGALLLVSLFAGSTRFAEAITSSKYESYETWQMYTSAWLPLRKTLFRQKKREEFLSSLS